MIRATWVEQAQKVQLATTATKGLLATKGPMGPSGNRANEGPLVMLGCEVPLGLWAPVGHKALKARLARLERWAFKDCQVFLEASAQVAKMATPVRTVLLVQLGSVVWRAKKVLLVCVVLRVLLVQLAQSA